MSLKIDHLLQDLHHHFLPQAYMAEEQKRTSVTHGNTNMLSWTAEKSLEEMDKAGKTKVHFRGPGKKHPA